MGHLTDKPYIHHDNILPLISNLNVALCNQYGNQLKHFNMLIVGGAVLALKYNFRMTVDIDADIDFTGAITDAINAVAYANNIPTDWLNWGFMNTYSYSRRLWNNAIFVTAIGYINVYVVNDIDQLCMKAASGRTKDLKDIVFLTGKVCNSGITYSLFTKEFEFLYGDSTSIKYSVRKKVEQEFKKYKMFM